jgi:hypothetical protein
MFLKAVVLLVKLKEKPSAIPYLVTEVTAPHPSSLAGKAGLELAFGRHSGLLQ